jgi:hypothetical protein
MAAICMWPLSNQALAVDEAAIAMSATTIETVPCLHLALCMIVVCLASSPVVHRTMS